jgi:hypothetical protein
LFPVRCELGYYIPGDGILHILLRDNLKSYKIPNNSSGNTVFAHVFVNCLTLCRSIHQLEFYFTVRSGVQREVTASDFAGQTSET